jgi:hypothetical protein
MSSKEKSFWIGFGLVMAILLGGSGFYMIQSLGEYNNASTEHGKLARKKKGLEAKPIFPSQENLDDFGKQLDQFEGKVDQLHDKLKQFQKPLESSIKAKDFPQILKVAVDGFRTYRQQKLVIIPDDFYFGMNKYEKGGLPPEAATGILKFQLDAIERLLKVIIETGSDEIYRFSREMTPLELPDGKDPERTSQVAKYTVTVGFLTTHDGFRNFLNATSNDKEFFYIVRVLRADNEIKEGPQKNVEQQVIYRNPETGEVVNVEPGKTASQGLVAQDARVIFGKEKLRVTAVVDLCRFPENVEKEVVEKKATTKGTTKSKGASSPAKGRKG